MEFWIKPNWSSGTKGHPLVLGNEVGEINTRDSGKRLVDLFLNQDHTSMVLGSQSPNTTRWVKHQATVGTEKDQWYESN